MTAAKRTELAGKAEDFRLTGQPGAAEALEAFLSRSMVGEYRAWLDSQAERHIAEHHRRRPKLPGER